MLQYLCNKPLELAESHKATNALFIPMVWREETDHISGCYFCVVPHLLQGFPKKKKWTLCYPNKRSAMRPISHGEGLPSTEPPGVVALESEKENA